MISQKRITSNNRVIEIYDDVFPQYLRSHHLNFIQNSLYTLNDSSSSGTFWQLKEKFFRCIFTQNDLNNFKFESDFISKKLMGYEIKKCWTLASSPLSTYYYHTDSLEDADEITVLYYVNTRWDKNWGGETLFSNDLGECEIAVEYKPGRIVIFDSAIEHKPSHISMQADEFRFIFVLQLRKNNL